MTIDEAAPVEERDSIPEPSSKPLLSELEFLERGHPGEILPGKPLDRMRQRAEAYVRDQSNPPDARVRVREVWLQGRYRPSYQHFTPRPDKDPGLIEEDPFG